MQTTVFQALPAIPPTNFYIHFDSRGALSEHGQSWEIVENRRLAHRNAPSVFPTCSS
jgi:hypothetical protein